MKKHKKPCKNLHYDYYLRCDCRDDDNCGCTFPNNMAHDFSCTEDNKENSNGSSEG